MRNSGESGRRKEGLTVNLSVVDGIDDGLRRLAVNLAANTVGSAENLLDSSRELLGERLVPHGTRNLNDLVQRHRLAVLDVLLLLAVAWGLCRRSVKMYGCDRRVTHP